MEQINSNNKKRLRQLEIFNKFATVSKNQHLSHPISQDTDGESILSYDDFIKLISNSKNLYSRFTDHSFNLNQIPPETFGCIFFVIDENNKGYLTVNDWFYFNNLLENDNYNYIILYEFFRKFDIAKIKAERQKNKHGSTMDVTFDDSRIKSINYSNRMLSFDQLFLNRNHFKDIIKLLQSTVQNSFVSRNSLYLNWDNFKFMKFYECFPCNRKKDPYLTLSSLITILQNDLKYEKLYLGFEKLSHYDSERNALAINNAQLSYLLRLFYSHRVSAYIFDSLNLSNTALLKSNNNFITYNVFKDIFYLFQNFDLLNQLLIKYATANGFTERDIRERVINKRDLVTFLNTQYNKVTNISEFSPSQINLLFSIVANNKENKQLNKPDIHHRDSFIDHFIPVSYTHLDVYKRQVLENTLLIKLLKLLAAFLSLVSSSPELCLRMLASLILFLLLLSVLFVLSRLVFFLFFTLLRLLSFISFFKILFSKR